MIKISNGQLSCSGNEFEDTCSYKCNDGFTISGPTDRTCLGNGKWSEEMPRCDKTPMALLPQCPPIDLTSTLTAECSNQFSAGSVCGFSCPTGYSLIGTSSAVCLPTGEWSTKDLPTCEVRIMVSKWFQDKAKSFQPTWRKILPPRVEGKSSESELCVSSEDLKECCAQLPEEKQENIEENDWLELLSFCASSEI